MIHRRWSKPDPARKSSDVFAFPSCFMVGVPVQPRGSDLLHARVSASHRRGAGKRCSSMLHRAAGLGGRHSPPGCEDSHRHGSSSSRLLAHREPCDSGARPCWEHLRGNDTSNGSGKPTALLCGILSESFLHQLLSP